MKMLHDNVIIFLLKFIGTYQDKTFLPRCVIFFFHVLNEYYFFFA